MDSKKLNEASSNILQASGLEVEYDDQEQEKKDQSISRQKPSIDNSGELSDAEESDENSKQISGQMKNDEGKNFLATIYFFSVNSS